MDGRWESRSYLHMGDSSGIQFCQLWLNGLGLWQHVKEDVAETDVRCKCDPHTIPQLAPQPPAPNSDTRPNVFPSITQQTTWHRSQYMYSKKTLLATRPVWPGQARPSNHILSSSPRPALQPPRPAPRACNHRPSPPAMGQRPIPPPPTCNQVTPGLPNKGKCIWGAGLK